MRDIAESNMLLRAQVDLPDGIKLCTEGFREGWIFLRSVDANRLERKVQARGWTFIRLGDGSLRSGVGDTSQEAVASALKLALRRVSEDFNAVEVEHIELTQYPWFFLARVSVTPYRIQQCSALPVSNHTNTVAVNPQHGILSPNDVEMYPHFGSATPLLKQILISPYLPDAGSQ